jgi:transaldolase
MKGLERRIDAGLSPDIRSVASLFVSRWDKATMDKVPDRLRDKIGPAIGQRCYKAYRDVLESERWQRLEGLGARAQRLLFASTGTKDPKASDVLYIGALAAPNTIDTMPEETLLAFAEHGQLGKPVARDGGDCEQVIADYGKAGIDVNKLGADLQTDGAKAFVNSWQDLLKSIESKSKALK